MWLYLHGSLPTAQVLGSRGLILDLMCKMCNKDYETIEHLFRGCEVAHNFYSSCKFPIALEIPSLFLLKLGLKSIVRMELMPLFKGIPWKILFPMGLWQLWLHINNFLFKIGTADSQVWRKCIQGNAKFFSIGLETKTKQLKTIVPVGWEKPPRG